MYYSTFYNASSPNNFVRIVNIEFEVAFLVNFNTTFDQNKKPKDVCSNSR